MRRYDGQPRRGPTIASTSGSTEKQPHPLAEDYRLRYALGVKTSGSAPLLGKDFAGPFACTLSVVRDGVRDDNAQVDPPQGNRI